MHKYDCISCNEMKNWDIRNKISLKNISNYEHSEAEWSVLEKGLNYAMPNFKKDLAKFVSTVENITTNITGISEEERTILRHQISSAINTICNTIFIRYECIYIYILYSRINVYIYIVEQLSSSH